MATENFQRLIIEKWFNCIFSITSEVMRTVIWQLCSFDNCLPCLFVFDSYDHLIIVYPVHLFMTSGHFVWLPWQNFSRKFVNDNLLATAGKETLLHISKEKRHCLACLLSGLVKRHRMCGIGGSGNMQLKYLFTHHFFTYSMKMRAWQVPAFWQRKSDYKKNDP